jgi:hypothetical protein
VDVALIRDSAVLHCAVCLIWSPGPLKVEVPMFLVLTTTTFPGPFAAARGEERGT